MEAFFRTHRYLVEHVNAPVRRTLMDEINWSDRLIGIKGTRGVGKTTFLLQYAKEHFDIRDKQCLYINMNNLYFQGRGIADFAGERATPLLRRAPWIKNCIYWLKRDAPKRRESGTQWYREKLQPAWFLVP